MKILIDGDACPSIDKIKEVAIKYSLELILVIDTSHNIKYEDIKTILVDTKSQSVDVKISNLVEYNDIVITNDYGLAVICLGKKANVVDFKGMIYTDKNIENLLQNRYLNYKLRKTGIHIKGPKKRTSNMEKSLIKSLEQIINCK